MGMKVKEQAGLRGKITLELRDAKTGRYVRRVTNKNITCTAGANLLTALLNGETTFGGNPIPSGTNWTMQVYGAVGTGAATPAVSDTALVTELQRVALAVNSRSNNLMVMTFFFTTSQANGTITEAGVFLMASTTPGSGFMLDHASLASTVKTSAVVATLSVQFTLAVG